MKILVTEKQLKIIVENLSKEEDYFGIPLEKVLWLLDFDRESDFVGQEIYNIGDFGKILLNIEKNNPLSSEDSNNLMKYSEAFNQNKESLQYDIDDINTMKDLYNLLQDVIEEHGLDELDEDEIEYLHNDSDVIVARPKTEKAAAVLASETSWPIAFGKYSDSKSLKRYENEFEELNKMGPIYIIIDKEWKQKDKKYMVHLASNTIVDNQYDKISLRDIMDISYKVKNALKGKFKKK